MNRNAFKVPLLNRDGVIPSEQTTIQVPDTIDSSFLTTIQNNPNANFLYAGNYYTLETVDETNKKATFFATSPILWSDTQIQSWRQSLSFTFTLPTTYSPAEYTYKIEISTLFNWVRYPGTHTDTSTGNQLTISLNNKTEGAQYRVTVSKKTYSVIGKILTIDFTEETPNPSYREIFLQGGGGGGSVSIDGTLSDTSTNPVQNRVITNALSNKATVDNYLFREGEILTSSTEESCTIIGSGKVLSDFVSKKERQTQSIVDLTEDNITEVQEIVTQNPGVLIRCDGYIYIPTYGYETIPSYYSCFASDELKAYYLTISWEEGIFEIGEFTVPSFTDTQWEKLIKLLDTINIEEI